MVTIVPYIDKSIRSIEKKQKKNFNTPEQVFIHFDFLKYKFFFINIINKIMVFCNKKRKKGDKYMLEVFLFFGKNMHKYTLYMKNLDK